MRKKFSKPALFIFLLFYSFFCLFAESRHYLQINAGFSSAPSGTFMQKNYTRPSESAVLLLDSATYNVNNPYNLYYFYMFQLETSPSFWSESRSILYDYRFSQKYSAGIYGEIYALIAGNSSYLHPSEYYYYGVYLINHSAELPDRYALSTIIWSINGPVPTILQTAGVTFSRHFPSANKSLDPYIRMYLGGGREYSQGRQAISTGIGAGFRYRFFKNLHLAVEAKDMLYSIGKSSLDRFSAYTPHSGLVNNPSLDVALGIDLSWKRSVKSMKNSRILQQLKKDHGVNNIELKQEADSIRLKLPNDILFAPGSFEIEARGIHALEKIAETLAATDQRIRIEGHTDSTIAAGGNEELSLRRAEKIAGIFHSAGIQKSRIYTVGHGAKKPVASNKTAEGRSKNRRIEIFILENHQ